MLQRLYEAEARLPEWLEDEAGWKSLYVDYARPYVERLWREWDGYRVYAHRIHPCGCGQALYHPHPWPSAIRVVAEAYEMGLGYGHEDRPPPVAAMLILPAGSAYEMVDPDGWHWVRPITRPTLSIMVTGRPWNRPVPKNAGVLSELQAERRYALFNLFRAHYPRR